MPLKLVRKKGTPNWYVRGTVARQYIDETTRTTDRRLAEAYKIRLERVTYEEAALGQRQPATWPEAVTAYLDHGKSERFILPVLEAFGSMPLTEIGQHEVDRAARRAFPKALPATLVRQFYTPVIAILNHAERAKLPGAAAARISKPKIRRKPVQWASDDYLAALIQCCTPRLAAGVLLMTYTGLRAGEVVRLRRSAFTAVPGKVLVGKTKSGKSRLIALSDATRKAVEAVLAKDEFTPALGLRSRDSLRGGLAWAARRAGLPYLSAHKIGRHAFAARLLGLGYSLEVVRQAGGWATLKVLSENYGHLEQSQIDDAVLAAATMRENPQSEAGQDSKEITEKRRKTKR